MGVGWPEVLSNVFGGVAALAAIIALLISRVIVKNARTTLHEIREANREARVAREQEIAARGEQLEAEIRHQRLVQTQRIVQLTTALAMIRSEPDVDDQWRHVRYSAVRLETLAALRLLDLLDGPKLPKCITLATYDGLRPVQEIYDSQHEVIEALGAENQRMAEAQAAGASAAGDR